MVDLHDRRRVTARELGVSVRDEVDVGVRTREAGRAAAEEVDLCTGPPPREKTVKSIRERTSAIEKVMGCGKKIVNEVEEDVVIENLDS